MPDQEFRLKLKVSHSCDKTVEDINNLWKVQEKADGIAKDNLHPADTETGATFEVPHPVILSEGLSPSRRTPLPFAQPAMLWGIVTNS